MLFYSILTCIYNQRSNGNQININEYENLYTKNNII